jgi:hypothetical protein
MSPEASGVEASKWEQEESSETRGGVGWLEGSKKGEMERLIGSR